MREESLMILKQGCGAGDPVAGGVFYLQNEFLYWDV